MFTMIFVIVFVLALPGNVTMFTNEARGTSVSGEENVTRNLEDENQWYDGVKNVIGDANGDGTFTLGDIVSSVMSFFNGGISQEDKSAAIAEDGGVAAYDKEYTDYTDAFNSLTKLSAKAMKKGIEKTTKTARKRAEKVQSSGNKIVDKLYSSDDSEYTIWDGDDYWDSWEGTMYEGHQEYRAGTFNYNDGNTYRNSYTGDETNITVNTPVQDGDDESVSQDLAIKTVVLQSCATSAVTKKDSYDASSDSTSDTSNEIGVYMDFGDSDVTEDDKKTAEYQMTRIIAEVAGRGLSMSDLKSDEETDSIYAITMTATPEVSYKRQAVEIEYDTGQTRTETEEFYNEYLHEKMTRQVEVPIMAWRVDHYDCYVDVTVTPTYKVTLATNVKQKIIDTMEKKMQSDEDKTAFESMVSDMFDTQYEQVCTLYGVPSFDDYNNGGGGSYSSMTPEEAAALLERLQNLDGLSSRQQQIIDLCYKLVAAGDDVQAVARSLNIRIEGGKCQRFVADLYASAGQTRVSYGSAQDAANTLTLYQTTPANGSCVYAYSSSAPSAGHVGIYIDGQVYECIADKYGNGLFHVMDFEAWKAQGYITYRGWATNNWDISQ